MFAKIINEGTKEVVVVESATAEFIEANGFTQMDVEQAYNGAWYLVGYAPGKPQEEKEREVRAVREQYFADYVDWYQSKPLLWEELTEEEKSDIAGYRHYLMDYTKGENWWEQNPKTFEEWKDESTAD